MRYFESLTIFFPTKGWEPRKRNPFPKNALVVTWGVKSGVKRMGDGIDGIRYVNAKCEMRNAILIFSGKRDGRLVRKIYFQEMLLWLLGGSKPQKRS